MDRFKNDDRLSPVHLALYFVLFQEWNRRKFVSPFPVQRDQMMGLAKIRSPNIYAKCMRELDHWGYIRYEPSYNQWDCSQVHLYRFNKRNIDDQTDFARKPDAGRMPILYENTSIATGIDNSTDKGIDTGAIPASIPFNTKELNTNTNKKNLINTHESGDQNSIFVDSGRTPDSPEDRAHTDHHQQEEKNSDQGGRPRDLEEVKTFFAGKKASLTEAEHFYHYFESIGWKIGKLHKPVENWRSAAKNWILNNNKHQHDDQPNTLRRGTSLVRVDKNYDQPL